eukprot:tig00021339_g20441.t1
MSVQELKRALRREIRARVAALEPARVAEESARVCELVLQRTEYATARSVAAYAAMAGELSLDAVVRDALSSGRRLFLPAVDAAAGEIAMLRVPSLEAYEALPRDSWGIPTPPLDGERAAAAELDLVLVPGLAFDRSCCRLGHGKRYYDKFLAGLAAARARSGLPPPPFIAVCLEAQVVDAVPVLVHDVPVGLLLTRSGALPP